MSTSPKKQTDELQNIPKNIEEISSEYLSYQSIDRLIRSNNNILGYRVFAETIKSFILNNTIFYVSIAALTLLHVTGYLLFGMFEADNNYINIARFIFPFVIAASTALCGHHLSQIFLLSRTSRKSSLNSEGRMKYILFSSAMTCLAIIFTILLGIVDANSDSISFVSYFIIMGSFSFMSAFIYTQYGFILPASCVGHNDNLNISLIYAKNLSKITFPIILGLKFTAISLGFIILLSIGDNLLSYIFSAAISCSCTLLIYMTLSIIYSLSGSMARGSLDKG